MRALYVILPVLAVLALAYRYYSAFIATRVMGLDDARTTPAHACYDGHNYYPTSRWVLFGHHFAAIAGAGPLIGPVLAAQFGYAPGLIWLVAGVCLAGAVQDFIILWASVRRGGRSLAEIARAEISPVAGITAAIAILFIIIIALAGLGLAVVNALQESAWGTFTIGTSIPLAIGMGLYMYRLRQGRTVEATVIGVIGLVLAVVLGKPLAASGAGQWFLLNREQLILAMAAYGFFASVLPVWLLLAPRDYLSSFMKIGTIGFLVLGVIIVNPELKMPAFTRFTGGGGPIVPGPLFPFAFITIACGAISGFHSLISSGTTPKMIDRESDIRPIGYSAMLMEGLVGVTALIAATALQPGDYFAINTPPGVFRTLDMPIVDLPTLSEEVGENVAGRTGGAVSLAVGMAHIFSNIPGMRGLMDYWYHFAIMFEALFILTTIDAGTRVARFLVQEFLGRFYKPFERTTWLPGSIVSTAMVVFAWAYFIWTGSISTIWPMFGIANQLLAAVALAVGTTIIINIGKSRYAWVTLLPMVFVATTTLSAGALSIRDIFWPMAVGPDAAVHFQGYLNSILTVIMMSSVIVILVSAVRRWFQVLSGRRPTAIAATGILLLALGPAHWQVGKIWPALAPHFTGVRDVQAASLSDIPREQQSLWDELSSRLDAFDAPAGAKSGRRPAFAAELLAANGNRGEALLTPRAFEGTVLYLDRLQRMGLQGVTVQMPYPLLARDHPRSEEYWSFYRRLAGEVRRRNLKLMAKTGPVFTQPEISPVSPDYSELSWRDYLAARGAIAVRIARDIQPDYLTFVNEPSTEAAVLGKRPQPPEVYAAFIRRTVAAMGKHGTLVGAGSGTWDNVAFVRAMAATPVDYIDLHVYPLASRAGNYLERGREMARLATRAGKRVVIGEFWLYKAAARELTGAPIQVSMFARDTFGFWSPLDRRMFDAVAAFAESEGIEYVSAFWSKYFFGALDYDRYSSQSPAALLRESDRVAAQNIVSNVLTDTGKAYSRIATSR